MYEHHAERPWTEAQWEAFMRESEARAARYGDLLETLINHPDRDAIIGREMGWDRGGGGGRSSGSEEEDEGFDADDGDGDGDDDIEPEDDDEPWREDDMTAAMSDADADDRGLRAIPAYVLAYETGLAVMDALEPYADRRDPDSGEEAGELLSEAIGYALVPGAKIAGGHAMGYDDEQICGNIVCCRKALAAAAAAEDAFLRLRARQYVPREVTDPLLQKLRATQHAIEERIADLRSRVWWQ